MKKDFDDESLDTDVPMQTQTQKQKPIHEVRLGLIKAAVWKNETDTGVRYNVTVCRLYKENGDDGWKRTESFGRDDLLVLAKALDQAHSWIYAQAKPQEEEKANTDRR